jgi:hypothetical protein
MIAWIAENLGTIIVSAVLIAAIVAVSLRLVKDRKKGKSSCGCGCASCAMSGACHNKSQIFPR